ncbi:MULTISPECIES: hypothetical protein [Providencia]|uniref:hypothetical protein n=1 Tax=Providencia TaxID=586 RepID=UPI001EFE8BA1|nr:MULTISPECIES: hypothetical protein [Providencia]MCG9534408.1 hypothetical protein [Providencia huaxiensis]WOC01145.1 hypothetical protein P3L55_07490 [Providencia sp. PROV046]
MNKEILEIAKHLKNKINSGEGVDEYNWQDIIDVCNELERINNLEPVVYASEKDISDLKVFTYLFAEKQSSESVNIPLYRLDKRF